VLYLYIYKHAPVGNRKKKTLKKAMEKVLAEETIVNQGQTKMHENIRVTKIGR